MISIRDETTADYGNIRRITEAAFARSELGHHGEADLVESLRTQSRNRLSLVACRDGAVVGHILFSTVAIRTPRYETLGMGLAPMSVLPGYQRMGIGSSLVSEGLARLDAQDCPFVVVLGHPQFYARFGFETASRFGVMHGFEGIPQDLFRIRFGPRGALPELIGGTAYYASVFG